MYAVRQWLFRRGSVDLQTRVWIQDLKRIFIFTQNFEISSFVVFSYTLLARLVLSSSLFLFLVGSIAAVGICSNYCSILRSGVLFESGIPGAAVFRTDALYSQKPACARGFMWNRFWEPHFGQSLPLHRQIPVGSFDNLVASISLSNKPNLNLPSLTKCQKQG